MFIEHNTVKVLQTVNGYSNIMMYPLNSTLALLNTLFSVPALPPERGKSSEPAFEAFLAGGRCDSAPSLKQAERKVKQCENQL